jgi:lipopolysaccharide heptosyltransferase I
LKHATTHRFLIVRLGSLGDVIHGIPAAAALRERFPSARIDWMVDPRYVDVLALVAGLDAVIPVSPRHLRSGLLPAIRNVRRVRYTAAIDLQGLIKSAALARAAGAWQTIGFPRGHLREPIARVFYSDTPDPGAQTHVVFKNLALLAPLGIRGPHAVFPIAAPVTPLVESIADRHAAPGYVLLNPGAGWPNKRWPPARFGEVASALAEASGLRSIVLWGPGEEALAAQVVSASDGTAEVSPPTTVPELFGIARNARLMIAGDTGPLHIAAAMGTPIVALFGPTIAARNGPWSPSDITLSTTERCTCLYRRRCRQRTACIDDISVEQVVSAAQRRLGSRVLTPRR